MIGAGIAGASAAYFLARAGWQVTVIDAGLHTASHVPSALINPVRGQSGTVNSRALEGMAFTWELLDTLLADGHRIPHGQSGVYRPVPDEKTRLRFEKNLPAKLEHRWVSPAEVRALALGWHSVLFIAGGGWVDGQAFCQALLKASGAQVIQGRAANWTARRVEVSPTDHSAMTTYDTDALFLCGGSVGSTWAGEVGTHRMGSMLLLDRAVSGHPLSFGAYLSPTEAGGTLGGTFETPSQAWQEPNLPLGSLRWLLEKGGALSDLTGVHVTGRWTGSRLSGLRQGQGPDGVWRLSGLSSKGFLLGPLLAYEMIGAV